jgi:hypothetical protein
MVKKVLEYIIRRLPKNTQREIFLYSVLNACAEDPRLRIRNMHEAIALLGLSNRFNYRIFRILIDNSIIKKLLNILYVLGKPGTEDKYINIFDTLDSVPKYFQYGSDRYIKRDIFELASCLEIK